MEHSETRRVVRCPECQVPISLSGEEEYKMTSHMMWYHPTDEDIVEGMFFLKDTATSLYMAMIIEKDFDTAVEYARILSDNALRIKKYAELKKIELELDDEIQEETD